MPRLSRRAAWWLLALGPALTWLAIGLTLAAVGRGAAYIYIAAALVIGMQPWGQISAYRMGFWRGRLSILDSPRPVASDQMPWDTEPRPAERIEP